jgi:hypothetical protein
MLPTEDKDRKALPLYTFMFGYFVKAWLAVCAVAVAGNDQHNKGEPLHWARDKSMDQMNTAWRHQFDYGMGVKKDTDGQWHLAKAIWRLSAQLQLDIEQEEREEQEDKDNMALVRAEIESWSKAEDFLASIPQFGGP